MWTNEIPDSGGACYTGRMSAFDPKRTLATQQKTPLWRGFVCAAIYANFNRLGDVHFALLSVYLN